MSGLFSRETAFLLKDDGNDRPGMRNFNIVHLNDHVCHAGPGRGNVTHRHGGRNWRGGRGRGNFNYRGGGRNSGRSYHDRDVPDDDGLGNEGPWSGREHRKL